MVKKKKILCKLNCYYLGRDGIPMEVMGLMLGEFVDDYTIKVDLLFFYKL